MGLWVWGFGSEEVTGVLRRRLAGRMSYGSGSHVQGGGGNLHRATVPEDLASETNAFIRGFYRLAVLTIDVYSASFCYGMDEFKHNVYACRSHRQVEDKW